MLLKILYHSYDSFYERYTLFKLKSIFTLVQTYLLANSPPGGRFGMLSVCNVRMTWTKSGTPSPCFFMISGNQKYLLVNSVQSQLENIATFSLIKES